MSDNYPEYLNPFADDVKPKTKLSIRHSFKELRNTLRKSFRIKKNDEEPVTIRPKTDTWNRVPVSYPTYRSTQFQSNALPRSRFQERLKHEPSTSTPGPNPFEEDEENKSVKKLMMKRKAKKKAPLPPKSLSSQDVNSNELEVPTEGSRWSLTSADTNYSDSVRDGTEVDTDGAVLEKIIDFNKRMETLKDDSNNNSIITKTDETNSHEVKSEVASSEEMNGTELETKDNEQKPEEDNQNLPQEHSENNLNNSTDTEETDKEKLVIDDITNNNKDSKDTNIECGDNEPFLYYEKQSLYIAGSRDELNDDPNIYRVSVHIPESEDLNVSSDDVCNETESETPIPKQRRNKLTKKALLGM